jgi:hypothetical protein
MMRRRGSFVRGLAALSVGLIAFFPGRAAEPARVVIHGPHTPGAENTVRTAVAGLDGVIVLGPDELARCGAADGPGRSEFFRREFLRRTRADLLLKLGPRGDSFAYIEGATGQELFRIREAGPAELAVSAVLLVEELRDAKRLAAWQVAVLDDAATARLAEDLRQNLRTRGVTVLPRALHPPAVAWMDRSALPPRGKTLTVHLQRTNGLVRLVISHPGLPVRVPAGPFPEPVEARTLADSVAAVLELAPAAP